MGILNNVVAQGLGAVGINTTRPVANPDPYGPDFDHLKIIEIKDGKEQPADQILLIGSFMPHQPFEFGGTQELVREYYPGNPEPTVQVLGPRETDTTIKGRFKTKNLSNPDLRKAALEYQELVDAMRIRGNLVRITLGEWKRYGFIEECRFRLNRLVDIEYEIKFLIVGFNPPTNCKFLDTDDGDLIKPNKEITNRAAAELATARDYPSEMPLTVSELLNEYIGEAAEAIGTVTDFVDGIVEDANQLQGSMNRAIGLIKNARATISRTKRNIGSILFNAGTLGTSFQSEAAKTVAVIRSMDHINKTQATMLSLAALLAFLQAKFARLSRTIPLKRHLVRDGDSLQKLAVKYYNDDFFWDKIYFHNKLRTTKLVVGTILEIPKL